MNSFVNPTYQDPSEQSLYTLMQSLKREILKDCNCAKVGVIQSFDAAKQEVTVQVAFTQVTSIAPDGTQTLAAYPLLLNVPVLFPGGGGITLTFPVAQGDECLVVFNDRQIDNWLVSGPGLPPTVGRVHDLSDGIAIVGLRNNTRALTGVSTTSAQLRSDDGQTYIDFATGKITLCADQVIIHSRTKVSMDSDGTGYVITPALISTYEDGVATADHVPNPPGPL